ncbi:MAG: hypothetical protein M3083_21100 [Actinomycetota bacterium]|nr:hypothetical protein [Actinomycetota bacterium]
MGSASYLIGLLVSIACAIGCYKVAQSKGRGPILWGILGFFFTIIPLIIILILPRKAL